VNVLALTSVLAQAVGDQSANGEESFQWTLVLTCWGVVLLAVAFLVIRTVQRGRKLSAQVPEEQRRWM